MFRRKITGRISGGPWALLVACGKVGAALKISDLKVRGLKVKRWSVQVQIAGTSWFASLHTCLIWNSFDLDNAPGFP